MKYGGMKRKDYREEKESFRGDEYVQNLDWGDSFLSVNKDTSNLYYTI